MRRPYKTIEGRVWIKDDGLKVRSLKNPGLSESERKRWGPISHGWYILSPDGIGWQDLPPYKTKREAQEEADRRNRELHPS